MFGLVKVVVPKPGLAETKEVEGGNLCAFLPRELKLQSQKRFDKMPANACSSAERKRNM